LEKPPSIKINSLLLICSLIVLVGVVWNGESTISTNNVDLSIDEQTEVDLVNESSETANLMDDLLNVTSETVASIIVDNEQNEGLTIENKPSFSFIEGVFDVSSATIIVQFKNNGTTDAISLEINPPQSDSFVTNGCNQGETITVGFIFPLALDWPPQKPSQLINIYEAGLNRYEIWLNYYYWNENEEYVTDYQKIICDIKVVA